MQSKIKAIEKFKKIEQRKRDLMSKQLEMMRQQHDHAERQLGQLVELRRLTASKSAGVFHSEMLTNRSKISQMFSKLIIHQEQEQALKQAECASLQKHLLHKHQRVKGLDVTIERWREEHKNHLQNLEEVALEELISARFVRKLI